MPSTTMGALPSESESPIRSAGRPPRSFSLSNLLSDLVGSSKAPQQQQAQSQIQASQQQQQRERQQAPIRRMWSAGDVEGMARCPYSAVIKKPHVPFEFQMPLHYPRYTRADYDQMPEWQVDRLLEEYGLPAQEMGSLNDKRQYAIGAFLWKKSEQI